MKSLIIFLFFATFAATAQFTVGVSTPKVSAQKALVPLSLSNGLTQKVESARAAVFLLDGDGKMIAQGTQWIIGGTKDKAGLPPGITNAFNFVLTLQKPVTTTNLTAKVTLNRVILEGGRLADLKTEVTVRLESK